MFFLNSTFTFLFLWYSFGITLTNAAGRTIRSFSRGKDGDGIYEPLITTQSNEESHILDEEVKPFIEQMNIDYVQIKQAILKVSWDYERTRDEKLLHQKSIHMETYENIIDEARQRMNQLPLQNGKFIDNALRNQFSQILFLNQTTIPTQLRLQMDKVISQVNTIYTKTKVGPGHKLDIKDIKYNLQNSDNGHFLNKVWLDFEMGIARKIKPKLFEYITLLEKVAQYHGFDNALKYVWEREKMSRFPFHKNIEELIINFHPFRRKLHRFIAMKLLPNSRNAGNQVDQPIPIHYLERIHSKNEHLTPFPGVEDRIKSAIRNKSRNIDWIDLADRYYQSLGFLPLPNHIKDNVVQLETSTTDDKYVEAWNFFNGSYGLMWTPTEPEQHMKNIFHGIGLIHNFVQFNHLPPLLQDWPNEVFKEAIVGAAVLSAFSPSYLTRAHILTPDQKISQQMIINRQIKEMFTVFGASSVELFADMLSVAVYAGYDKNKIENEWWGLLSDILRIDKPAGIDEDNFGPGIVKDFLIQTKYWKRYLSEILKYQFFQHLCVIAGKFNPKKPADPPLNKCDITGNEKAGKLIRLVMQQGNSLSWEANLKLMTGGETKLNIQPQLNYYYPLDQWLSVEMGTISMWLEDKLVDIFMRIFKFI